VEALEYGMPPAAGFGYSERLFALLMDKSVREMQFFPLMKPEKKLQLKKLSKSINEKLLIATTNVGKLKEISSFLSDLPFKIVSP